MSPDPTARHADLWPTAGGPRSLALRDCCWMDEAKLDEDAYQRLHHAVFAANQRAVSGAMCGVHVHVRTQRWLALLTGSAQRPTLLVALCWAISEQPPAPHRRVKLQWVGSPGVASVAIKAEMVWHLGIASPEYERHKQALLRCCGRGVWLGPWRTAVFGRRRCCDLERGCVQHLSLSLAGWPSMVNGHWRALWALLKLD